jgi:uncharacterized membrane protein YfcA
MELLLAIGAGVLLGVLNTVASSGSAVTLPLLMVMGLSPAEANGTNRVPVLIAALVASLSFIRAKLVAPRLAITILLPTVLGSLCGAMLAEQIPADQLRILIVSAVLVALALLFLGVKQALLKTFAEPLRLRWQEMVLLFGVGVWLGLIVLDGATYLLLILILALRMPLVQANVYKNLVLFATSVIALVIFGVQGDVNWEIGGLLALGSIAGAYVGAKIAVHPHAKIWTYRLLVTIILLELGHMALQYLHIT